MKVYMFRAMLAAAILSSTGFAAAQEGDSFDETLPPPGFGSSQTDFFDLPEEDLDLDLELDEPETAEPETEAAAPAGDPNETVALELTLPDPYFGGTPLDYSSPNLEKPNYKPRPDFMVPGDVRNVALGKPVTASAQPKWGSLDLLVDGDTHYAEPSVLGLPVGTQWVQIDLGAPHDLWALALWHFHEGERVYFDVVIQIADDAAFTKNVRTVFNNDHDDSSGLGAGEDLEYLDDYRSKFIDLKGHTARAIRFYSNGNTTDDFNHYIEAKVFGRPAS